MKIICKNAKGCEVDTCQHRVAHKVGMCEADCSQAECVEHKYPCPKCKIGELYDNGGMFMATYLCTNPVCDYVDATSDAYSP